MNIDFDDQLNWKKIKCVGNNSAKSYTCIQHFFASIYFAGSCKSLFLVLNQANYEEKKKKHSQETQWLEIKRSGYRNGKRVLPFVAPLFRDLHILLSHQTIIPRFNISLLMDVLRAQFSQNKPRSILYWFCVAKQLNGPNKFIPNNLPSDMNFYHFLTFKYIHHYLTR